MHCIMFMLFKVDRIPHFSIWLGSPEDTNEGESSRWTEIEKAILWCKLSNSGNFDMNLACAFWSNTSYLKEKNLKKGQPENISYGGGNQKED